MNELPEGTVTAKPKAHPWARSEVRYLVLCIALVGAALIACQVFNIGRPAKGTPVGAMPPSPAAVDAKSWR